MTRLDRIRLWNGVHDWAKAAGADLTKPGDIPAQERAVVKLEAAAEGAIAAERLRIRRELLEWAERMTAAPQARILPSNLRAALDRIAPQGE